MRARTFASLLDARVFAAETTRRSQSYKHGPLETRWVADNSRRQRPRVSPAEVQKLAKETFAAWHSQSSV